MKTILPANAGPSALAESAGRKRDDPAKVKDAAKQFEALLLNQLLNSVRESGSGGWMGTGSDAAGTTMVEIAEQQLAQALAAGGGIGLAKMVVAGLTPKH